MDILILVDHIRQLEWGDLGKLLHILIRIDNSAWFWWPLIGFVPVLIYLWALYFSNFCAEAYSSAAVLIRFMSTLVMWATCLFILLFGLWGLIACLEGAEHTNPTPEQMLANIWWGEWNYILYYCLPAAATGVIAGYIAVQLSGRYLEPQFRSWLHAGTRRASRDQTLTDVRTIKKQLPTPKKYDLCIQIDQARKSDSMFLGVDEQQKAVLVDRKAWKSAHTHVMGPTGTGKGVLLGVAMTQAIRYGDALYFMDPKLDKWGASVIAAACESDGKPFAYLNLRDAVTAQCNPLLGITPSELEELLISAFGLSEKGTDADHYRKSDRQAARVLSQAAAQGELSMPELADRAAEILGSDLYTEARGFVADLEEVAEIPALQTRGGIYLEQPLLQGGAIYIVGQDRNRHAGIGKLQRLLLVRILQLIENRTAVTRHATVVLDEFTNFISAPALGALRTIRDKGGNVVLAHQSLGDLADCPQDLNPAAVKGVVLNNTQIKWLYRQKDQETARWISGLTGTVLVDREQHTIDRNPQLAESVNAQRTVQTSERALIDVNMIQHLPDGCAVYVGTGQACLAFISPVIVPERHFESVQAEQVRRQLRSDALLMDTDLRDSKPP